MLNYRLLDEDAVASVIASIPIRMVFSTNDSRPFFSSAFFLLLVDVLNINDTESVGLQDKGFSIAGVKVLPGGIARPGRLRIYF